MFQFNGPQKVKRWLGIGLVAVLLLAGGATLIYWLLFNGYIWLNMPSFRRYPIQGLDVSAHQGSIDWPTVARGPWSFVYLKASEGGNFKDPRFAANWAGSGRTGLPRGAYHFFTFCRSGAEQAANFIAMVPRTSPMLPPVADLEFGGNCSKRPAQAELNRELKQFLARLETHYQRRPVLYVTESFARTYLAHGEFAHYPLWVRDILREPRYFVEREWRLWQFSNRGRVPGIQGRVDQNVFAGSPADFQRFILPVPPAQP